RRHRGHPRPAGGRHHHRQERDEWAEWRLRHRWGRRRLRPAPQSAQPRARDRRIVVGFGRGRGRAPGRHLLRRRPGRLHPHSRRVLRIIGHKPTFGLVSHFGIGFGSDQSIDYTGPMTRTVEDAAAALQATAGYDAYDPRQTRDVPARMDVLGRLTEGIARLRIGVLQEGFDDADVLAPRTKLSLIAAELSRRNYHGRVYAKAQNVRPAYIKAYDAVLSDVDVLVMPTCIMTAPRNHRPGSHLEAVEDNLMAMSRG